MQKFIIRLSSLVLCVGLTACSFERPTNPVEDEESMVVERELNSTEEISATFPETEKIIDLVTEIAEEEAEIEGELEAVKEPVSATERFDPWEGAVEVDETTKKLKGFYFKDNNQYKSCVQRAAESCQREVIYAQVNETQKPDACKYLSSAAEKTSCADSLWQQLASLENDPSYCKKLSNDRAKISCANQYLMVRALEKNAPELCDKLRSPDGNLGLDDVNFWKNQCLNRLKMEAERREQQRQLEADLAEQ